MQHTEDGEHGKINRPPLVDQKHRKLPAHENSNLPAARQIVESILREGGVSQFVELYYWSLEPGTLDLFRSMARLPEPARSALADFLSHTCKGKSVTVDEGNEGQTIELRLWVQ